MSLKSLFAQEIGKLITKGVANLISDILLSQSVNSEVFLHVCLKHMQYSVTTISCSNSYPLSIVLVLWLFVLLKFTPSARTIHFCCYVCALTLFFIFMPGANKDNACFQQPKSLMKRQPSCVLWCLPCSIFYTPRDFYCLHYDICKPVKKFDKWLANQAHRNYFTAIREIVFMMTIEGKVQARMMTKFKFRK